MSEKRPSILEEVSFLWMRIRTLKTRKIKLDGTQQADKNHQRTEMEVWWS